MRTATTLLLVAVFATVAFAAKPGCATIPQGTITDSAGNPLQTGNDPWGYNYQALMFNGYYDNNAQPTVPVTEGDSLVMKWNDAWLSNQDCDFDHKLDRHFGYLTYRGSGAWVTNHQKGTYLDDDGKTQKWEYFIKIVAAPADATLVGGNWVGADGIVIGPAIWGEFAIIQEVSNDTGTGDHGALYKSPAAPSLGFYKP
jgi:hypothetical protein